MKKEIFIYPALILSMFGCSFSPQAGKDQKEIAEKIDLAVRKINAKDWPGLYHETGMDQVQADSEQEFLEWAMIKGWDANEFRIDSYEITKVYLPEGPPITSKYPQALVSVKIFGSFYASRSKSALLMTFMKKDKAWHLYVAAEIPQILEEGE